MVSLHHPFHPFNVSRQQRRQIDAILRDPALAGEALQKDVAIDPAPVVPPAALVLPRVLYSYPSVVAGTVPSLRRVLERRHAVHRDSDCVASSTTTRKSFRLVERDGERCVGGPALVHPFPVHPDRRRPRDPVEQQRETAFAVFAAVVLEEILSNWDVDFVPGLLERAEPVVAVALWRRVVYRLRLLFLRLQRHEVVVRQPHRAPGGGACFCFLVEVVGGTTRVHADHANAPVQLVKKDAAAGGVICFSVYYFWR